MQFPTETPRVNPSRCSRPPPVPSGTLARDRRLHVRRPRMARRGHPGRHPQADRPPASRLRHRCGWRARSSCNRPGNAAGRSVRRHQGSLVFSEIAIAALDVVAEVAQAAFRRAAVRAVAQALRRPCRAARTLRSGRPAATALLVAVPVVHRRPTLWPRGHVNPAPCRVGGPGPNAMPAPRPRDRTRDRPPKRSTHRLRALPGRACP